jgi:hypothetical protein
VILPLIEPGVYGFAPADPVEEGAQEISCALTVAAEKNSVKKTAMNANNFAEFLCNK